MWKQFFNQHAERYDENPFTHFTQAEVDFLIKLYPTPAGSRVLDVGCGTGRHAIEFARRGFQVTGIDLSEGMLAVAKSKADALGVEVEWICADATSLQLGPTFDYAICICEGGVGLIQAGESAEEHDKVIFRNIAAALKPNAPFVLTALNGYSVIRRMSDERIAEGIFDPASMVSHYVEDWDIPGFKGPMKIYERLFIPPEISKMLQESGFAVDNIYGGTAGYWGQRFVSLDEMEAMFICRKA